uniref:Major facilitator superfamily (MFS) profile domain-containing protein n=1 Tax=Chromera velia CCMP2878 TaxID=1169474 RepID=A0A0G4HC48_9ALVE|eukprot:Cvel_6232.t1-p1 / transcript=Cvel_6232.t1 / gene=Cvel_6232 / organism=Chromera_velia_CCMP2878 / gene_product=hypothetical protein / transcript_product=hypothetical protein / location=Cvel_scaffold301:81046-86298(-) / protein_length=903 / sequence_SO=supercontig / SO=protein_coding / is_pseudo=false
MALSNQKYKVHEMVTYDPEAATHHDPHDEAVGQVEFQSEEGGGVGDLEARQEYRLRLNALRTLVSLTFILNYDHGAVPAVIDDIASEFTGLSFKEQALIGSLVYAGLIMGTLPSGLIFQQIPGKGVLLVASACLAIALLLFALSGNLYASFHPSGDLTGMAMSGSLWTMYVTRTLTGLAQALPVVYVPVWIDEFAPPEKVTRWMSYSQLAAVLGQVIGYFLSGVISKYNIRLGSLAAWKTTFILQAFCIFPVTVNLFSLPDRLINCLHSSSASSPNGEGVAEGTGEQVEGHAQSSVVVTRERRRSGSFSGEGGGGLLTMTVRGGHGNGEAPSAAAAAVAAAQRESLVESAGSVDPRALYPHGHGHGGPDREREGRYAAAYPSFHSTAAPSVREPRELETAGPLGGEDDELDEGLHRDNGSEAERESVGGRSAASFVVPAQGENPMVRASLIVGGEGGCHNPHRFEDNGTAHAVPRPSLPRVSALPLSLQSQGGRVTTGTVHRGRLDSLSARGNPDQPLCPFLLDTGRQILYLCKSGLYILITLGMSCLYFVVTGIQFWVTKYLTLVLNVDKLMVVSLFTFVSITAPTAGVFLGGIACDRLGGYRGRRRTTALKMSAVFAGSAASCAILAAFASSLPFFVLFLWLCLFNGAALAPVSLGVVIAAVPSQMRSLSSAFSQLLYNLLGYCAAPLVAAAVMDGFRGDTPVSSGDSTEHDPREVLAVKWGFRLVLFWSLLGLGFFAIAYVSNLKARRRARTVSREGGGTTASIPMDAVVDAVRVDEETGGQLGETGKKWQWRGPEREGRPTGRGGGWTPGIVGSPTLETGSMDGSPAGSASSSTGRTPKETEGQGDRGQTSSEGAPPSYGVAVETEGAEGDSSDEEEEGEPVSVEEVEYEIARTHLLSG